jgi:hypothetical protein
MTDTTAKPTERPKYITWPNLVPIPDDALIFRRRWAGARGKKHLYEVRRQLAHDYAMAKCSGK